MKAIPKTKQWDWTAVKSVDLRPDNEPLVPLGFYPEKIVVSPQYFLQGLPGALPEMYLRQSAYERLLSVADNLPDGYKLLVYDAWRSIPTQQALYDTLWQRNRDLHPDWDEQQVTDLTLTIVALPSIDPLKPSPHNTGGSIDLTLVDEKGLVLPMGTPFDEASERAASTFLENIDIPERDNRRLLYHLMIDAGFTNYNEEWWHFDYGNQNWAWVSDAQYAIYGPTEPEFAWRSPF